MFESMIAICIGVGLAASCGLRVFAPLLVVSMAAMADLLTLSEGFNWLATYPALAAMGTATVLEIAAYYIPWVDNALDAVATPVAMIAGAVVTAACITEMDPLLKWSVAIIAGGGTAGVVKLGASGLRLGSTATTGGVGNPILSTLEWLGSLVLSAMSVVVPILAAIVAVILVVLGIRFGAAVIARFRNRKVAESPYLSE